MIDLTITSVFFLFCLIIGPLLMAQNIRLRRWSFLIVCLCLFLLSFNNIESLFAMTVFIALPYCYIFIIRRGDVPLWPIILTQLILFIYVNQYAWILSFFNVPVPSFISILGVSYIFFRQLDVLFQVKARLVQTVSIIDYLNYLLSFWTILAGPIQRYRSFIQTFYDEKQPLDNQQSLVCFHRAANGMIKILLLGAFFQYCSSAAYIGILQNGPSWKYIIAIFYCFPLFLYFNFSGYCDVVIGMAKWAGFTIPENFDRPYLSRDMIEMWNRWHITMSQWLRDYVYQPLFKVLISGIFRNYISFSQYLSIFITFSLVGIWHGTTLNFIVFGLLQGLGMAASMIYRDTCKNLLGRERYKLYYNNKWVANIERFVTLNFWCFTFLFFQFDVVVMLNALGKLFGI